MSAIAVVDASALAAVVFNEPLAGDVVARLSGKEVVAPRLLGYELTNAAVRKIRKHPAQQAAIIASVERALADDVAIVWSDVDAGPVLQLALETGLTAYDAAYLWLARHLRADLVTLDAELDAATR
jgi:predicted nucleic acid-binding protein